MKRAFIFLTDGFEEIEAVTIIDILRRGAVELSICSITGEKTVKSARNLAITCDMLLENADKPDPVMNSADALILPGGQVLDGYASCGELLKIIRWHVEGNKLVAAICAAPVYLGKSGLLSGKAAVCYPGMEKGLSDALPSFDDIVYDTPFLTAKGPGMSARFALRILEILHGADAAKRVAVDMLLTTNYLH